MGIIEVKQENQDTNKLSLYKSLVEEYKYKIDIYEVYFKKIGIDKDALLKAFGYDGVMTASTKINSSDYNNIDINNNNLASIDTNQNNNINTENSEEINKEQSLKNLNNIVQIGDNSNAKASTVETNPNKNSISTSNNLNNNKLASIEEEKQESIDIESILLPVFD
mgnify:CR=1 FL=1